MNQLYGLAVRNGIFNMDEYRHAIERMEPRHYLTASYYERSLTSLATLLVEKGIVSLGELERRAQGEFPLAMPSAPGRTNVATRERFNPGDRVRVRLDFVPATSSSWLHRGKTGCRRESPCIVPRRPAHGAVAGRAHGRRRFAARPLPPRRPPLSTSAFQRYLERSVPPL